MPKCVECFSWINPDDPDEACKLSFRADPNDDACDCFCAAEDDTKPELERVPNV